MWKGHKTYSCAVKALILTAAAVVSLTTSPSFSAAQSNTFTRDLTLGSTGPDVLALQGYLNAHGTLLAASGPGSPGHETDYFGTLTQTALARFQKIHGINPPQGYFGPITRSYLASGNTGTGNSIASAPATGTANVADITGHLSIGSHGQAVTELQTFLKQQGFFTYPAITGYFGPVTKAAVQAFQSANGIEPVGWVGPETRAAIHAQAASTTNSGSHTTASSVTNTASTNPACPQGHTCVPGTSIIEPQAPANYAPGFGGGWSTAGPILSGIGASVGTSTATVSWTSSRDATSKIEYGLTTSYGATLTSSAATTTHSFSLPSLYPDALYHYEVISTDTYGRTSTSGDHTFTTSKATTRNTSLGVNLNQVDYYDSEQPFLDIFKTHGSWITGNNSTWDTNEEQYLQLDANGYPTTLAPAGGHSVNYTLAQTLIERNFAYPYYPAGQYIVLYDGEGTLAYRFDAVKNAALSTPGRDVLDVTPSSSGIDIEITSTDPNHTGDYIRNIRVVYAPYEHLLDEGKIFNPDFLEKIAPFSTLRFMDWMRTINSSQSTWAYRPQESYASWATASGTPAEIMVDLANQNDSNPWFNMPIEATDNYITQFATLVHDQLSSTHDVYVELSNEVWNSTYSELTYAETEGKASWASAVGVQSDYTIGLNWFGMRTAQMCQLWKDAWGSDASRVHCVLGTQSASTNVSTTELNCSLWADGPCDSKYGIDSLATAPYFASGYSAPNGATLSDVFSYINGTAIPSSVSQIAARRSR